MARSDKRKTIQYNNDYNANNYDRISLMVPKGAKEAIKERAKDSGESVNAYINRLIEQDMNRDREE